MAQSTKIRGMSQKVIDREAASRGASVGPTERPPFDPERLTPEQRAGHAQARRALEERAAEEPTGRRLRVRIGDEPSAVEPPRATKKRAAKKVTKKKAARTRKLPPVEDDDEDDDDDEPRFLGEGSEGEGEKVDLDDAEDVTDDEGEKDGNAERE